MVLSNKTNTSVTTHVAYGLTLSSMFFIYVTILLIIYMIALINIEPYKKIASNYIPTDLLFAQIHLHYNPRKRVFKHGKKYALSYNPNGSFTFRGSHSSHLYYFSHWFMDSLQKEVDHLLTQFNH